MTKRNRADEQLTKLLDCVLNGDHDSAAEYAEAYLDKYDRGINPTTVPRDPCRKMVVVWDEDMALVDIDRMEIIVSTTDNEVLHFREEFPRLDIHNDDFVGLPNVDPAAPTWDDIWKLLARKGFPSKLNPIILVST